MNVVRDIIEVTTAAEAIKDALPAIMNISEESFFEAFIAGLVSTWRKTHGKTVDDEVHMYRMMAKIVRDMEAVKE